MALPTSLFIVYRPAVSKNPKDDVLVNTFTSLQSARAAMAGTTTLKLRVETNPIRMWNANNRLGKI